MIDYNKRQAVETLQHYIIMLMRESDLNFDNDTFAELESIVSNIVDPLERKIDYLDKRIMAIEGMLINEQNPA